jgi:cephalosporin hydroxylase
MFKKIRTAKDEQVKISVQSIYEGHHQVTYKGIKAIRCPFDYVIYQMIINEVKPDLIIEIGSNIGGGALYIADLLDANGKGILHTIDIVDMVNPKVKEHNRIKFFTKGWEDYDLELTKGFETILIIEDALHLFKDRLGY